MLEKTVVNEYGHGTKWPYKIEFKENRNKLFDEFIEE